MYLFDNPVLQRELLGNLRMNRAFLLLLVYLGLLGGVVWVTWPDFRQVDMTSSVEAKERVDFFFLGQSVPAGLLDGSQFRGGDHQRRKRTQDLRKPAGQSPGAGGDYPGKTPGRPLPPGHPHRLLAANRDAVRAVGWRVAVRSAGRVSGLGRLGDLLWHDQSRLQQLFSSDRRGLDGVVSNYLAAGLERCPDVVVALRRGSRAAFGVSDDPAPDQRFDPVRVVRLDRSAADVSSRRGQRRERGGGHPAGDGPGRGDGHPK